MHMSIYVNQYVKYKRSRSLFRIRKKTDKKCLWWLTKKSHYRYQALDALYCPFQITAWLHLSVTRKSLVSFSNPPVFFQFALLSIYSTNFAWSVCKFVQKIKLTRVHLRKNLFVIHQTVTSFSLVEGRFCFCREEINTTKWAWLFHSNCRICLTSISLRANCKGISFALEQPLSILLHFGCNKYDDFLAFGFVFSPPGKPSNIGKFAYT